MAFKFNADEVFEIAEEIERNGARFYRKAAENAENLQLKKTLTDLAEMEVEHEQTFRKLRAQSVQEEWKDIPFDEDGQAGMYLRALADGKVFDVKVDPVKELEGCRNTEDVLHAAIRLEKESVVFYTGMQEMVPPKLGRDLIATIIREEMGHITMLAGALKEVQGE